jgi:uncharacterized membrane protein
VNKGRLEAFSDGVFAIIITIMVLELKAPHGSDVGALLTLIPVFLSYLLSFIFVAIYWNNHHHTFQVVHKVNGAVLWANLHLLFWLSLTPFVTDWMGENNFSTVPVALYGGVLFMSAVAYTIMVMTLVKVEGNESTLAKAVGRDSKGKISLVAYGAAIFLAPVSRWISMALYVSVAIVWVVPDRRIEKLVD